MTNEKLENKPYYVIKYTLWPKKDDAKKENGGLGRHIEKGHYHGDSKIDAINAVAFNVRGRRSHYELACVDAVQGPYDSLEQAMAAQEEL